MTKRRNIRCTTKFVVATFLLSCAAHLHGQASPTKIERPTIAKAYTQLFGIALVCDELDTKKTGAAKRAFLDHVVTPTARISDKYAAGGEIRNFIENPPTKMIADIRLMLSKALPSKLKEMRGVCANYARTAKELATSINSFVDVTIGDLIIPPVFVGPSSAEAASTDEDDEGPIPDAFSSRDAFQLRVQSLWATATACIDPEPEKYTLVVELWHSKLTPKIIEKTDEGFSKSFARFKGSDDPLYELNRIKTVIPGIAEDCKALASNVQKLISADVP